LPSCRPCPGRRKIAYPYQEGCEEEKKTDPALILTANLRHPGTPLLAAKLALGWELFAVVEATIIHIAMP